MIEVITPEVPSIRKIKRQIYLLKKNYDVPVYKHQEEEVISFSWKELVPTPELKANPIVLEVGMTMKEIENGG